MSLRNLRTRLKKLEQSKPTTRGPDFDALSDGRTADWLASVGAIEVPNRDPDHPLEIKLAELKAQGLDLYECFPTERRPWPDEESPLPVSTITEES